MAIKLISVHHFLQFLNSQTSVRQYLNIIFNSLAVYEDEAGSSSHMSVANLSGGRRDHAKGCVSIVSTTETVVDRETMVRTVVLSVGQTIRRVWKTSMLPV